MYSAGNGNSFSSPWHELYRLDRVLAQLTRPSLDEAGISASLRDQIRELGLPLRRAARREELIAEVWGRKRPLLRRLDDLDDDTPPPCA
jgi:hypothetical protein